MRKLFLAACCIGLLSGCGKSEKKIDCFTDGSPVEKAANTIGVCLVVSAFIRGAMNK